MDFYGGFYESHYGGGDNTEQEADLINVLKKEKEPIECKQALINWSKKNFPKCRRVVDDLMGNLVKLLGVEADDSDP